VHIHFIADFPGGFMIAALPGSRKTLLSFCYFVKIPSFPLLNYCKLNELRLDKISILSSSAANMPFMDPFFVPSLSFAA